MWHFLLGRLINYMHYIVCFNYNYALIENIRSTTYTEYSTMVKIHEDLGNKLFSKIFSYNHYRLAWHAFLHLLDIDMQSGFMCPICEDCPSEVVMDATSLSFRKDFDPLLEQDIKPEEKLRNGR